VRLSAHEFAKGCARLIGRKRVASDQQLQVWGQISRSIGSGKLAWLRWRDWRSHAEVEMLRG
jgi:hypothetical protein